ncbi:30S ribosomal protein S2 [Psychroflexus sp. MBR-150]|jgi:small subunit ribosomal protein S2
MAKQAEVKELLDAGVHFGHLTRRWNPNMAPYIYMERNGIHIINLYKTAAKLDEATNALTKIAASGRKILFVATKKQAKEIVAEQASKANQPYITERWPGGMLTNFVTIRKSVKKMAAVDRMKKDGSFDTLSKKEKLQVNRMRAKLEKNLGSISDMTRLPGALFVVDIIKENIAVKEAQKLNIPVFAMVDTNSDPREVDYVIPANDDASKSINKIISFVADGIIEGLDKRENQKKEDAAKKEAEKKAKEEAKLEEAKKEKEKKKAEEDKKADEKAQAKKTADKVEEKKETKTPDNNTKDKKETSVKSEEKSKEEETKS